MRLPLLVLLALVATAGTYAADASPKPSDTNNQPANATTKPPTAPTPPPGATTPKPATPPPGQQPPAPSTPAPTTAPLPPTTPPPTTASNVPPPANTTAAPTSTPAPAPTPTPEPTPTPTPTQAAATDSSNTSSSDTKSSGMGAGAIVGIVLACVGLVGIIAFFAYRHFRARREDAQHGYDDPEFGGASPVLESSRAHDAKMYASFDLPKHSRQTTTATATATPTDDIVLMTKYATPSSPKFADNPPQLSPPPSSFHHLNHSDAVADFTKSTTNFDQSRGPGAAVVASTEFAHSYREGSYAESYAESYAGGTSFGGGSFMNSFDHGMLGRETFRDTLTDEENATPVAATAKPTASTNGLAGLDNGTNKDDSHWMEAMDEMRDTNDSYAMLEAGGSYNSRGSAMRFSTESDLRG